MQKIRVACGERGMEDYRDVAADVVGGLAVHPSLASALDAWTVTHVGSGYSVRKGYASESEAKAARARVLPILDWTVSAAVIGDLPADTKTQIHVALDEQVES